MFFQPIGYKWRTYLHTYVHTLLAHAENVAVTQLVITLYVNKLKTLLENSGKHMQKFKALF
jgi:hypothetical protein